MEDLRSCMSMRVYNYEDFDRTYTRRILTSYANSVVVMRQLGGRVRFSRLAFRAVLDLFVFRKGVFPTLVHAGENFKWFKICCLRP